MSIVTALPAIAPTARSFRMDQWPQKELKMRGGRTAKWPLVNTPAGASMELAWENITHAQAEQLAAVWDANYGLYGGITLDTATLAGLGATLAALIQQPFPGAQWCSQGPPVIESVKAGRCTVRLPLRTRNNLRFGAGAVAPSPIAFWTGVVTTTTPGQWSVGAGAVAGYSGASKAITPGTWGAQSLHVGQYTGTTGTTTPGTWLATGTSAAAYFGSLMTTSAAQWAAEVIHVADYTGAASSTTPGTWEAQVNAVAGYAGAAATTAPGTWEANVAGDASYTGSSMTTTPGTWTATGGGAGATGDSLARLYEDDLLELF